MSGYQYTYPRDLSHFDVLPEHLRATACDLSYTVDQDGLDWDDVLRDADLPEADKALIAEVLG